MIGKSVRMERIFNRETDRTVIIPMDHGVTVGPIRGIKNVRGAADLVAAGGADAAVVHKGAATFGHRGYGRDLGLILHLSASTNLGPDPNNKVLVATVEEALKIGADGVSIQVNVGAEDEARMLATLGETSRKCQEWGMPLLAMMYPRGPKVSSEHAVEYVRHAARIGAELGVDIVKTNYTGSPETFKEVVKGCSVPVVIAGGPKMETEHQVLEMVRDSISVGGAGLSIGRNIFQAQDPTLFVKRLCKVVHENYSVEEAEEVPL